MKKLYSIDEIKEIIPLSQAGLYKLIAEGQIPSVKLGRRVFVPSWYVEQLLSERAN